MKKSTIVALVATKGLEDFLLNALTGLIRVGVDPKIVHVARPENAAKSIDRVINRFGANTHSFTEFGRTSGAIMPERYVDYGSGPFIEINWAKVRYIRWLLDQYSHVVYADLDVGWIADPLWYLQSIAQMYPLAFQTEACRRFPPIMCWGFLSAKASRVTRRMLDILLKWHDGRPRGSAPVDEQAAWDAMITADPTWLKYIYPLPEGLFPNGLGYRNLLQGSHPAVSMHGTIEPFVFHANWTVGLEAKRALMRQTRTWLLD